MKIPPAYYISIYLVLLLLLFLCMDHKGYSTRSDYERSNSKILEVTAKLRSKIFIFNVRNDNP